jgi:hypothetical protein
MTKSLNKEDWKEGWEHSVHISIDEVRKLSSNEIIEKIKQLNNPNSPVWAALWSVLGERKERDIGLQLIEVLKEYTVPADFIKRAHCSMAIFKIFDIENLILSNLITGPSNDFNLNYFKLGIKRLQEITG